VKWQRAFKVLSLQTAAVWVLVSNLEIVTLYWFNVDTFLQVYETELEKVPEFKKFRDFCQSFKLTRGKNADELETSLAGEFKVLHSLSACRQVFFYLTVMVVLLKYLLTYSFYCGGIFSWRCISVGQLLLVSIAWWSSCSASSKDHAEYSIKWTSWMCG